MTVALDRLPERHSKAVPDGIDTFRATPQALRVHPTEHGVAIRVFDNHVMVASVELGTEALLWLRVRIDQEREALQLRQRGKLK